MSIRTKITWTAAGVFGLTLAATAGIVAYNAFRWLVREVLPIRIPKSTYDSVAMGQSDAELAETLPVQQPGFAAQILGSMTPPPPAGADCRYYMSKDEVSASRTCAVVYRICFAGGKVVDKERFEVDVTDVPPPSCRVEAS